MKVCEICGSQAPEENEAESRRVLYVCENCRTDRKFDFEDEN
ncbi:MULTISPECIES: hypothetical protein [Heyndrickxia]|uniref:Uncharacterized protein n=2 Tax=Heyndrickxia coagulans TaxID=1398 RepID=A0A150KI04_HEYCO|nr:hypothetical protein [Heyndrickxia coagulans]AEH54302.1 hypothetical protein BCO26_2244 [Heyndrickxia coagulans 2-6]KYC58795.1 hypothetical protein B4100_2358 [Heyndrickxia coagulans]KYC63782.1 hypothetical protein B4098_2170 [Heyndrickxia coagulans]KYC72937.1 hypothetical protein B4099_2338 [Heyndrickxia coagulans]MDL5042441.1 hypothetical protein [Heyndrickxia coagulans]